MDHIITRKYIPILYNKYLPTEIVQITMFKLIPDQPNRIQSGPIKSNKSNRLSQLSLTMESSPNQLNQIAQSNPV